MTLKTTDDNWLQHKLILEGTFHFGTSEEFLIYSRRHKKIITLVQASDDAVARCVQREETENDFSRYYPVIRWMMNKENISVYHHLKVNGVEMRSC